MRKNKNAFTLIELMIFVALIGIISALFVPPFLNYLKKVKSAEAQLNIKKIADLEIAYFKRLRTDESGKELPSSFLACTPSPSMPSSMKKEFIVNEAWNELGFLPNGPVYYSYEAKAKGEGTFSEAIISAHGDLDDDGVFSTFSLNLYVDSETNEIKYSDISKINELE